MSMLPHVGQVTTRVEPLGNGSVIDSVGTGVPGESRARGALNNAVGYVLFGLRNYIVQVGCDAMNGHPVTGAY